MTDPARNYARTLAAFIAAARDLLNDDGYAAVLPAIEALAAVIPDPPAVPSPREARDDQPPQLSCSRCGARPSPGQSAGEPCPAGGCGGRIKPCPGLDEHPMDRERHEEMR